MKKNVFVVLAALVAVLGMTGCNDYSSPEAVLGSAYKAMMNGKFKAFKATLTGEAKAQYGTVEKMNSLWAETSKLQMKLGTKTYLWGKKESWVRHTYAYSFDILGKTKDQANYGRVKTAEVTCVWTRGRTPRGNRYWDDNGTPDTTECLISALK